MKITKFKTGKKLKETRVSTIQTSENTEHHKQFNHGENTLFPHAKHSYNFTLRNLEHVIWTAALVSFFLFFDFKLLYILSCPGYCQVAPCVFTFWAFKSKSPFFLTFMFEIKGQRLTVYIAWIQASILQTLNFIKRTLHDVKCSCCRQKCRGLKHNKVGGEIYYMIYSVWNYSKWNLIFIHLKFFYAWWVGTCVKGIYEMYGS